MQGRNTGIDLFKCLLMLGVCVYHAFFLGGYANGFESRIWTWCVPGFAFISGYYGVDLKVRRIVNLWCVALCCNVLPAFLSGGGYWNYVCENWYLMAYTVLILISPMVNAGLSKIHETRNYGSLIGVGVVALWAWLSEFSLTRSFVPQVAGIKGLSFVSVGVAYVLAWACREFSQLRLNVKWWWLVLLFPLMSITGHYDSPVTLLFVIALFNVFEKITIPLWSVPVVESAAKAGFAVYVLHANWPVIGYMRKMLDVLIGGYHVPRYCALFGVAVLMYVAGVVTYCIVCLPIRRMRRKWMI